MASKIRGRIVDAAIELYAQNGLHGTTTIQIAKRADVTEGSLFRLFRTKEKLFDEALEQSAGTMLAPAKLRELLAQEDAASAIRSACHAVYFKCSPNTVRLSMFARLERPDLAEKYFDARFSQSIRAFAGRLRSAKGEVHRDLDPEEAAVSLFYILAQTRYRCVTEGMSRKRQTALVEKRLNSWLRCILKS